MRRHRAKPIPLFFGVQFIIEPPNGVFINISQMLIIVLTVANNMIIGAILPYIHAVFLVTKSFECRYEPRRNGVLHCRDRRPRRSVCDRRPRRSLQYEKEDSAFLSSIIITHPIISQIGRENKFSAEILCLRILR